MKKINLKKIKNELENFDVNETTKELIINNILLYNDLLSFYNDGDTKKGYFLYQLNMQIFKQLMELKKDNKKDNEVKSNVTSFIDELKKDNNKNV